MLFFGMAIVTGAFAQSGDRHHNGGNQGNQCSQQGNYGYNNQSGYGRDRDNYSKRDGDHACNRDREYSYRRRDRNKHSRNHYYGGNYHDQGEYDSYSHR
jgi:hypothetical protein